MDITKIPQYELLEHHYVRELESEGYLMRHKKTGARVFILENDDNNKVFNIAFRTVPTDSTGVAHIIEHTVLCGSDRYPVKDPFVELAKGSLNTFLNAMTYSDKTMYPLASTNDKDFFNLMSVYMDGVFHPNITKERKIFEQEGWHYEMDSPDGELTYNGVVYNEMKGAFSSADEILGRQVKAALYPDTTYAYESGGDPEFITDLTYESYLEFYHTYYHPSNSYIYLYGDLDMEKALNWMDHEYLSHYEKKEIDSAVTLQKPFNKMKEISLCYAASEDDDEGTYFTWSKVVSNALDLEKYLAFQVLEYVLLDAPGAPLKQALLDAGIGVDIYGGFEDGILQPSFEVTTKDARQEQREIFVETIEATLRKLAEEGLQKRSLLAGLNSLQFRLKEGDFGRWPKGLMYGLDLFDSWLYDDNAAFLLLETQDAMDELYKKAEGSYFEQLIKECLIDNSFGVVAMAVPKVGLDAENEEKTAEKLRVYKDSLSKEEIEEIVRHTKELKEYQETPSTKEELETIPMLTRADIKRDVLPLYNEERSMDGVKVLFHEMSTKKIGYLELVFDADFADLSELPYLSLLKQILGVVAAGEYSYTELMDEVNIHTGGIDPGFVVLQPETGRPTVRFSFRIKAFYHELETAVNLTAKMMYQSDLANEKRLLEIIGETRSQLYERLKSAGHNTSIKRASSYHSESGYLNEIMTGISFYEFLNDLYDHFEERKGMIIEKLRAVSHQLFNKRALLVSFTADKEGYDVLEKAMDTLIRHMPDEPFVKADWNMPLEKKNEGICCASQIQFVGRTGNYKDAGLPFRGSLLVLQNILNYDYLWIRLRVKGGAYGCMSGFGRDGDCYMVSYLDPKLAETNEVYDKLPEYLEQFDQDERSMDRYVIGAISEMDIPKNPAALGVRGLTAYLSGITREQLQKERDEVIDTDAKEIRALVPYAKAVLSNNCLCVVGNENKIKENSSLFITVRSL